MDLACFCQSENSEESNCINQILHYTQNDSRQL